MEVHNRKEVLEFAEDLYDSIWPQQKFYKENAKQNFAARYDIRLSSREKSNCYCDEISKAVMVTQFLLRDYLRNFFEFANSPESTFKSELQFVLLHWLKNRDDVFMKIIDTFAVIAEAVLYLDWKGNFNLDLEEVTKWFVEWFEKYMASEFYENGDWKRLKHVSFEWYNKVYEDVNDIVVEFTNFKYEEVFFECLLIDLLRKSPVMFPIPKRLFCDDCKSETDEMLLRDIVYVRPKQMICKTQYHKESGDVPKGDSSGVPKEDSSGVPKEDSSGVPKEDSSGVPKEDSSGVPKVDSTIDAKVDSSSADGDREDSSSADDDREDSSGADGDREDSSGADGDREDSSGADGDREDSSSTDGDRDGVYRNYSKATDTNDRKNLSWSGGVDLSCSGRVDLNISGRVDLNISGRVDLSSSGRMDLSCTDKGNLSCSDRVDLSCSDRVDLSCSDRVDLSCSDRMDISGSDRVDISSSHKRHLSGSHRRHLSGSHRVHLIDSDIEDPNYIDKEVLIEHDVPTQIKPLFEKSSTYASIYKSNQKLLKMFLSKKIESEKRNIEFLFIAEKYSYCVENMLKEFNIQPEEILTCAETSSKQETLQLNNFPITAEDLFDSNNSLWIFVGGVNEQRKQASDEVPKKKAKIYK